MSDFEKWKNDVRRQNVVPCPTCGQYSHSVGADQLADAFNHFQSMIAHPVRGHPMGFNFDEQTRKAAQVLMTVARFGRFIPVTTSAEMIDLLSDPKIAAAVNEKGGGRGA